MLVQFLNISKSLPRPISFRFIRGYCQHLNENESNSQKTADHHESKLLEVLNNLNNWSSFKQVLTEKKFNLIQKYKAENGGFITKFDDIVQIKGFSKKTVDELRKFCESIQDNQRDSNNIDVHLMHEHENKQFDVNKHLDDPVNNNNNFILYDEWIPPVDLTSQSPKSIQSDNSTKKCKSLKLYLEPRLTKFPSIRSFTSIYQDANAIAYTQFLENGNWSNGVQINAWNYHKVETVGVKHISQLCMELSQVANRLPESDVYIMDDHIKLQHFRKANTQKKMSEIIQMGQQLAILVTLLQNKNSHDLAEELQPNVFSMNYSTVARLYDLLVGHEATSTENIIRNILNNSNKTHVDGHDSLPIEFNENIKNTYFKMYPVERECLGKSMLIGLTFVRLGLLKASK